MKTVEIVKTAKGWYVTRRYGGQNKGAEFFSTEPKVKLETLSAKKAKLAVEEARKAAEKAKDAFIKEWMGE